MLRAVVCPCGRTPHVPILATSPILAHRCPCGRRFIVENDSPVELPWRVRPALLLDLDGTVRRSKSGATFGPVDPDDVELLPGVEGPIWAHRSAGDLVVGVTNQGVVGYGTRTELEVEAVIDATRRRFDRDPFDFVLASYAHAEGTVQGWTFHSLLRKPGYGMLVLAELRARETGVIIDWPRSLMVGDRPEDQACAVGAGVPFRWAANFFGWSDR